MIPHAKPPWTSLGKKLESQCRKALLSLNLLDEGEKLGIALSGGKDSLTLLFLLKVILGKGAPDKKLYALHVSGDFSCGPSLTTDYVKKICDNLNVPLLIRHSKQTQETLSCYPCSRERRKLLFEMANKENIDSIAFGHHKDDAIETLLLNLLHKGEFAGLLPKVKMHRYGVTIIRPLIYIDEPSILEFAKLHHFHRVSCQCPIGQSSKRKEVKELLNTMEHLFPNGKGNLFHAMMHQGSDKALFIKPLLPLGGEEKILDLKGKKSSNDPSTVKN